jgi:CRISPR-associated protein Cmr4
MVAGAGLKGALRNKVEQEWKVEAELPSEAKGKVFEIFGSGDGAGGVSISDARLLLLPVRSLTGHFRWITCPYILERYARDLAMINKKMMISELRETVKKEAIVAESKEGYVFLEELSFTVKEEPDVIHQVKEQLEQVIPIQAIRERLTEQLVILPDDEFAYFAKFGLPIYARNSLHEVTKKSQGLWYEETLPPDTLMYSVLIARPGKEKALTELRDTLEEQPYIQVGGNETVGQGWFITRVID